MRYVAETRLNADLGDLQKIFPFKQIQLINDDVFSFELSAEDSNYIDKLIDNSAILRVYTEESYRKLNKNVSISQMSSSFKLIWYGRCDKFVLENGDSLILSEHKDILLEVWKPNPSANNFISWNSKMHDSIQQPFSNIREGNLFLIKLNKNNTLEITGLTDTNQTEVLGISNCGFDNEDYKSELKNEYNLIWYGACESDSQEIIDLVSMPNIIEVHQFSEKGYSINGVYYANDSSKSTITKLKFGNGYLVKLKKNTTQIINGCVVSDHVNVNSSSTTNPLRLTDCSIKIENTPTPEFTPSPIETPTPEFTPKSEITPSPVLTPTPKTTPTPVKTPTPEPTPTPLNLDCCTNGMISSEIKDGIGEDKNYISVIGNPDGRLCWNEITESSHVQQYKVSLGENYENGGLSISVYGNIDDTEFRFKAKSGGCYSGVLSDINSVNIFSPVDIADFSPTPKPISDSTPTPELIRNCCEGDTGIVITKGMSDSTNPTGPGGITISGFEEGGVLCVGNITSEYEPISCVFKSNDDSIGGLITLSFKLVENNIIYTSANGKCYKGTIENTISEPQILTEV